MSNQKSVSAAKNSAYSPEEEKVLVESYNPDEANRDQVAAIAKKVGRSVHSVRSKLSNLGVYVKDESPKSAGKKGGVNKLQLAEKIAPIAGLSELETEALAKTTMTVLQKLFTRLAPASGHESDVIEFDDE